MKIAIPAENDAGSNSKIGGHFGRVPFYTIYDTETKEYSDLPNTSEHFGGTDGMPPELLNSKGINVMLVSGIGNRAILLFDKYDIGVFTGLSPNTTAEKAVSLYESGELTQATKNDGCKH